MSAFFLFFGPIGIAFLTLFGAALTRPGDQQAVCLGLAAGLTVAWVRMLLQRDRHNERSGFLRGLERAVDRFGEDNERMREAARRLLQ